MIETLVATTVLELVMSTIVRWLRTRPGAVKVEVALDGATVVVKPDDTIDSVVDRMSALHEDFVHEPVRVHEAEGDTSADAALVARLRAGGFTGPEYERLERHLASYGFQVIGAWVRSREVFARCAKKRIRGVVPPAPEEVWSEEDLEELVADTVARALVVFQRDALRGGGWRPDGGASLATYFVGTCLFAFAEVYRRRRLSRQRRAMVEVAVEDHVPADDLEITQILESDSTVVAVLETIPDPRLRLAVYLRINGYTHAEIAEVLADGTTARGVEGLLYRFRRQAVQDREVDHDDQ